MADTSQAVKHLEQGLLDYGSNEPPFVGVGASRDRRSISVCIIRTGEIQPIKYLEYPCKQGKRSFATIRINQQRYIIKPLPGNWKRGDEPHHHRGCTFWYVWQGLDEEFVGEDFPGPVARSMPRAHPGPSPERSDSTVPRPRRDRNRNRPSYQESELETSSSPPSGSADSDYSPSHVSRESTTAPSEGQSMDLDGPEIIDLTMLSSDSEEVDLEEIPPLVPNDSLRDFESDGMESLTREEENAIFLRVRLDKDMELYTSVFFRDARPKDDPSGPVTLDSFFDLIDRTLMPREGRIQFLQAEFWERHHRIRTPYDRREDIFNRVKTN